MWRDRIRSQPMFDILQEVRAVENRNHHVIHLEIGDTQGFDNVALRTHINDACQSVPFAYSPSPGEPELRKIVADLLSRQIGLHTDLEQTCIAPANALITQSLAAVATEGDTVLIPNPGFPTYELASDFLGLEIARYNVFDKGVAKVEDFEKVARRLGAVRPIAIIISNPSNPLGYAFDWSEFDELFEFALANDTYLIFDETYVNLTYEVPRVEAVHKNTENVIRLRSLSKEHAAPGLRIGYCRASPDIIEVISRFSSLMYSCLPSFIQIGVGQYLKSTEAEIFVDQLKVEMASRIDVLVSMAKENNLALQTLPNATFYAFIGVKDGNQAFRKLLDQYQVAVCPGSAFGSQGRNAVRLSLAGKREDAISGIDRVISGLHRECLIEAL